MTENRWTQPTIYDKVMQWFVDRERALNHFCGMLDNEKLTLVLAVEGPTGIGKSWLLSRLVREAEGRSIPGSVIDFQWRGAFDKMFMAQSTARQLGLEHFPELDDTLERAIKLDVMVRVEPSPEPKPVSFYGPTEVHGDVVGGHMIKGEFNVHLSPEVMDKWVDDVNKAFFADLGRLGLARGAVLLYDSFERATPEAARWIERRLLQPLGRGELPGVWLAIAGRETPGFDSAWEDLVFELSLDPFAARDVRHYLRDKRELVISEEVISSIFRLTGGQPDEVAVFADAYRKDPEALPADADRERLIQVLVEGILKRDRQMCKPLEIAAIPEWFDASLLADLQGTTKGIDELLTGLQDYSFIQASAGGRFRFLAAARQTALAGWKKRPLEFSELETRAANHFAERARHAADPMLREEYERQAVGHALAVESTERAARERLRALFEDQEAAYRLAACQRLLERAEAVEDLSGLTRDWLRYLRVRLALARRDYQESADGIKDLLEETDLDPELRALAGWSRGQIAARQGRLGDAIDSYEGSLQYFAGQQDRAIEGQVLLSLGDVHLAQAQALGGPIQPRLLPPKGAGQILRAIPRLLVVLPFVLYARLIQRWRLPPLHHASNYRNWALARVLLTAEQSYLNARDRFVAAGAEDLIPVADLKLAHTFHRLGWWREARRLFDRVLASEPITSSPYWKAQVGKDAGETQLSAGQVDEAIVQLEASLKVFEDYGDERARAEAQALLGSAWLRKGQFEDGLAQFKKSLDGFSSIGDQVGTGAALHALRGWVRESEPTSEQATEVEKLIANTREKTYLPRVQDRLAAALELLVSASFVLVCIAELVVQAELGMTPPSELIGRIFSLDTLLGLLGGILVFIWVSIFACGLLGLLLIWWESRREPQLEHLNRIVTDDDSIRLFDYRGVETHQIPWESVQATVSVDRVLWRAPISLLSEFKLFGAGKDICVPATILWYDELKKDIEDHLQQQDVQPVRRRLDVCVLRSWPAFFLVLFPLLLGLQRFVTYNVPEAPIPLELATIASSVLMLLGLLGLIVGPYWWLALYPLRVRYEVAPGSRIPLAVGVLGLIAVASAFAFGRWQPFFPVRNMLNATVFPLGFVLVLIATLWVLFAREWAQDMVVRGKRVYQPWLRAVAAVLLPLAVVLSGLFAQQEYIPYFHIYRAITYLYRDHPQDTIEESSRALLMNPRLSDGYYFRSLAHSKVQDHPEAVADLSILIEGRGTTRAAFYLFRALAYLEMDDREAACDDLQSALTARRWQLSERRLDQAQSTWTEYECDELGTVARHDGSLLSGDRGRR
jgi:tetratricopeptide (TPR) repeat protein